MTDAAPVAEVDQVSMTIAAGGARFGSGPVERTVERFVAAVFTADAAAARRLLPGAALEPLRVSRGRALVFVYGATYVWRIGSLPEFRSGEVAALALVTRGPSAALVPLVTRSTGLGSRHAVGSVFLAVGTTNRLARDVYRQAFGLPAFLADVRHDQRVDADRFRCTESGGLVLELIVRTGTRPREVTDHTWVYGRRDDVVTGFTNVDTGTVHRRRGRGAARLRLGDHPAAGSLHGLVLSRTPLFGDVWTHGLSRPGPVEVIGEASPRRPSFDGSAAAQARLVVSRADGEAVDVDQQLTGLPFDPSGPLRVDLLH